MIYTVRGKCNVAIRDRTADLPNAILRSVIIEKSGTDHYEVSR